MNPTTCEMTGCVLPRFKNPYLAVNRNEDAEAYCLTHNHNPRECACSYPNKWKQIIKQQRRYL